MISAQVDLDSREVRMVLEEYEDIQKQRNSPNIERLHDVDRETRIDSQLT